MEDDDFIIGQFMMNNTVAVYHHLQEQQRNEEEKVDMRGRNNTNRSKRKTYNHDEALQCINRDYLGPDALFGSQFTHQFRISRARFERLAQDIMNSNIPFYQTTRNLTNTPVASLQAKLLLPLKTYAYGVPPKCFCDYFQMSFIFAANVCKEFDDAIIKIYMNEYLRLPTKEDLKSILKLHKAKHGVDGLMGSLDCTHTYWKNCPTAWKGSYSGRNKAPSIVLEAACDHNLWFWHLSYGHCGCLNDINILNNSHLFDAMLNGDLHKLEQEAGVVPFMIGEESFDKVFLLVDGIYPKYNRFAKTVSFPITVEEKKYAGWQEAVRKDIERAFGVLKGQWQVLFRPILLHQTEDISKRASACFILHNMCVSDRVMGDVTVLYKPDVGINIDQLTEDGIQQPNDLNDHHPNDPNLDGNNNMNRGEIQELVTRGDRYRNLMDAEEYSRLHTALIQLVNTPMD